MNREARTETPFRRAGGPPRALLIAMAIVLGVPSWGCVTVAEHRKLERRVKDMQRSQAGDESRVGVANLVAEMDEMRAEIRGLRGQIEETEKRAAQALEEAKKARREAAAAAIGARSPGATPEGDPTSSGGTAAAVAGAAEDAQLTEELKAYQEGIAAWRAKDYPACIDRFRSFLQTHASSSRADDAAFWIADCHFKQGEFKNAVLRFDDVVRNYPTGNRAPDALYRQGESLLKLGPGFHEAARRAFERVLKEYPDSARAAEARKQLQARAG